MRRLERLGPLRLGLRRRFDDREQVLPVPLELGRAQAFDRCELAARDPNVAVRRLAVICLKNGTPQPATIQLLEGIAESDDAGAELRKTARVVQSALKKKAIAR